MEYKSVEKLNSSPQNAGFVVATHSTLHQKQKVLKRRKQVPIFSAQPRVLAVISVRHQWEQNTVHSSSRSSLLDGNTSGTMLINAHAAHAVQ